MCLSNAILSRMVSGTTIILYRHGAMKPCPLNNGAQFTTHTQDEKTKNIIKQKKLKSRTQENHRKDLHPPQGHVPVVARVSIPLCIKMCLA